MSGEYDFDPDELAMLRQLFRSEAHESLEQVTARLLAAGSARPSSDALTEMMQVTHTLKGAAGTVGLHAMVDLSHRLENALAALATTGGEASWTAGTGHQLVDVLDAIRSYLDHASEPRAEQMASDVRTQIARIVPAPHRTTSQRMAVVTEPTARFAGVAAPATRWPTSTRDEFDAPRAPEVHRSSSLHDVATDAVPEEIAELGLDDDAEGAPGLSSSLASGLASGAVSDALPDVVSDGTPHEIRARAARPADGTPASGAPQREPSAAVARDAAQSRLDRAAAPDAALPDAGSAPEARPSLRVEPERVDELLSSAGELLFDRTRIERRVQLLRTLARDLARTRQTLHDALADGASEDAPRDAAGPPSGEPDRDAARADDDAREDAAAAPDPEPPAPEDAPRPADRSRPSRSSGPHDPSQPPGPPPPGWPATARKLALADSELAGHATLLSQTTAGLLEELEALRRTIGQLQRGLTRIRMESARSLMAHAARTLRALRRTTGVAVELRTVGEETEFDKAVAEQLLDPITQLLRNAVAHGIEPASERAAHGKPPTAAITIRARQDGNALVLELSDDGRGIDTAALCARLVETGRWTRARALLASDADVHAALLDASVSVRDEADELAGRGVGLGLVRQTVAMLGGEIAVVSTSGKGTTFSLRLPLSAVLAHAMLFKVEGQVYAIPNMHVAGTTHVGAHATTALVGPEVLPVVRLEHLLGQVGHGAGADRKPALVVSFAGKSLVCTVDKIIGAREVIIKPLGPLLAPLTLYAGATISGSGKVQLILDPAQLVRRAYPSAPAPLAEAGSAPLTIAGRALVVDDSRAIREAMTSMLGSEGWIVDVAEDGARALQLARKVHYDLVVTDLEMPTMGGFALIARLRDDARFSATPVVIITSRASPEHRRRARELGVAALVAKPITRRKLLEALAAR